MESDYKSLQEKIEEKDKTLRNYETSISDLKMERETFNLKMVEMANEVRKNSIEANVKTNRLEQES